MIVGSQAIEFSKSTPIFDVMRRSDILREDADNCLQLAERADDQPGFRRHLRMAQAWAALADEQDWLDGEVAPLGIACWLQ